jgi:hypothetical protein
VRCRGAGLAGQYNHSLPSLTAYFSGDADSLPLVVGQEEYSLPVRVVL